MKSLIAAFLIAAAMIGGGVVYTQKLDEISKEALSYSQLIAQSLQQDDFSAAMTGVEALEQYVEEKKILMSMILDHTTLDKIESNLAELSGFVEGRMKTDAQAKGNVLEILFKHLPKNYKIRLENIL